MISKYFFLLMSIIFFSCNHSKEKVINNFDTTVKALQSLPGSSLTKITIEPAVYFFDSLEKGSEVMGRFLIKNIGTKNFRIRRVVSGCDCVTFPIIKTL